MKPILLNRFYLPLIVMLWCLSPSANAQTIELVDDINPISDSNPCNFAVYNGKLYFAAYLGTWGTELWSTDGTAGGTSLVKDIYPGSHSSFPGLPVIYDSLMYFTATDLTSPGIWQSDGTASGTVLIKYINSNLGQFDYTAIYDGKIYFQAYDSLSGNELWVSDGTTAGTTLLTDIYPGKGSSNPYGLTVFNGKLYFQANDSIHGTELWVSDGTAAGTHLFEDINPGPAGSAPGSFSVFNNYLYFNAQTTTGPHAMKTDGTPGGTSILIDSLGLLRGGTGFTEANGLLYFAGNDSVHGTELWATNGTIGSVRMVKDIYIGIGNSSPSLFTSYNGSLYFAAQNSSNGVLLCRSDGSEAGTTIVKTFDQGIGGQINSGLPIYHGHLYMIGATSADGSELWTSDGTASGTHELLPPGSLYPDALFFNSGYYPIYNDALYFAAFYTNVGNELYRVVDSNSTSGISPEARQSLHFYPDPARDRIYSNIILQDADVRIMDMTGKSWPVTHSDYDLDISLLPPGIYCLHLQNKNGSAVKRFIKE